MISQAAPQLVADNYEDDDVDHRLQALEARVGKAAFEKLEQTYPGQWWRVDVPHKGGVIKIMLPFFTGKVWGYLIPMNKIDPGLKVVVNGGGELLERFGIPRTGFNEAKLSDALDIYGKTPPSIANGFELGERPTRKARKHIIHGVRHGQ